MNLVMVLSKGRSAISPRRISWLYGRLLGGGGAVLLDVHEGRGGNGIGWEWI